MKIFIGLNNTANIATNYCKGFRALGHEAITAVNVINQFYPDSQHDFIVNGENKIDDANTIYALINRFVLNKVSRISLFFRVLASCDLFIFIGRNSFLPYNLDFPIMKLFNKKIVSTFWGSDIRYPPLVEKDLSQMGVVDDFQPFLDYIKSRPYSYIKKIISVRMAERYANLILSQAGYGQLQTRPYMRANIPLLLSDFIYNIPKRKIPKIIHAPSNRNIKGTSAILDVVNKLKSDGIKFNFQIIENLPNYHLRKLLTEADIVVDELYSETIGVLSTEAMASGCVTLTQYLPQFSKTPPGCPAVNVTEKTLYEKLLEIIINLDLRCHLAETGRLYVEKYFNHIDVVKKITTDLYSGKIDHYDFLSKE